MNPERSASLPVSAPIETARAEEPCGLDGFDPIYRAHFHEVLRWIGYQGVRSTEAEDLAQKVFEVVLRRLPSFDGQNLRGWLFGITRRVVASHRRLAWVRSFFGGDDEALDMFGSAEPALEHALARKQQAEWIFARMSEKLRVAYILHEIEGHTAEEIAALTGTPVATVHSRLRLGRARYLELVGQLLDEERRAGGHP